MELTQVIKKPLITEKSLKSANSGRYIFVVDKKATKKIVKTVVETFFKVNVQKVWLIKCFGKFKRSGRMRNKLIKKPDWKKAIVQVKTGQKIDVFEEMKAK